MTSPVFSIITVTYNASKWLKRTILSILGQSYPHIEYIVVDGSSTDGTVDIIKQYASGITYWISEPDKGLYDAMNKGMRKATGEYVWFINAGDTLFSMDTVNQIVTTIQKKKQLPEVIYGETAIADAKGNQVAMRRLKAPDKLTWKSFRMGMLVCHQSFIARREMVPEYDLQYRFSADYAWCIECLKRAKHIANTRMILSNFLEAGMSAENRKVSLKERYQIMCIHYGKITTTLLHGWFAVRFFYAKWVEGRV